MDDILMNLQNSADFSITPCEAFDKSSYTKLNSDSAYNTQMSALLGQIPHLTAASALNNAYILKFPDGLPHTLMKLHQGGYASTIIGDNGRIVGTSSLYPLEFQGMMYNAFSAMSAVSGQYFLKEINDELRIINTKLDDILSFLHGEKKAELMAEISFVKYAYNNYSSIMSHGDQRIATIASLQESRKIAMKDIDFYLNSLESNTKKKDKGFGDLCDIVDDGLRDTSSIEMARQLYVISGILEVFYSQNYDNGYISYMKEDLSNYINKCDHRINGLLSKIEGRVDGYKPSNLIEKVKEDDRTHYIGKLNTVLKDYHNDQNSPLYVAMMSTLSCINQAVTYYVNGKDVYMKAA